MQAVLRKRLAMRPGWAVGKAEEMGVDTCVRDIFLFLSPVNEWCVVTEVVIGRCLR